METIIIMLSVTLLLVIAGIIELRSHNNILESIPVRIHVNGTRGKSSVSRLIGAGLRAGGIRTITKVTGTYPRLILEDGSEFHINRKAGANIIEQLSIVKKSADRKAEALVVECMALQPEYQKISEHKMIRSSIGVITNVRADHLDVMGPTPDDVAWSISGTVPKGGILVTGIDIHNTIRKKSLKMNTTLITAGRDSVTQSEMEGFGYIEHNENVAISLKVCDLLGVPRKKALGGMYKTIPDEGALTFHTIRTNRKTIKFINAFAANDPDSTLMIRNMLRERGFISDPEFILLNTRSDRMDRSKQLVKMIGSEISGKIEGLILMGDSPEIVNRAAMKKGINKKKIIVLKSNSPEKLFAEIVDYFSTTGSILAIGNMGGGGGELAEYFKMRSSEK